ncbi:S8 family serine peptidase [Kitasatospora sp. YST-16]|uniref:S8 family serine peptidase n=1 Tax=Kitasatospora sp. YST-16 TaxID=2998080 RepID=UPI002283385D|nr:S8 family serine peptidase [Kitasatospora sp. YST-16]WAL71988.1 S8 family serine peptidase [Kitasatospora sp. YST-16]WNW38035.1 S8 family serine peptidase [Streptomyces sp. Li-HN-5-13]
MTLTKAMRVLGATTLTGALLFSAAPMASADQVRDAQWANSYFNLDKVWSVSKGDGVIVAVIDSGVDANHPDLAGSVLPGYDPSGHGWDAKPTEEHGTGMASLIAGHGHGNGEGILGLAPGAKILPIYRGTTTTTSDAMPQGIKWAVDHGAKVINISQVTPRGVEDGFADAVSYALQHKVLIVAGSGNDAGPVRTPANIPGVLAVGAVDKSQKVWAKSNYGPEVMLTAPGADMVMAGVEGLGSCQGQYCKADGTSDSTAYVSAAAALVFAKYPDLTPGQVANRLVKTAAAPAGAAQLPDAHYGYGIVQPYAALTKDVPAGSAQGPLAAGAAAPSAGSQASTGAGNGDASTGGLDSPGAVTGIQQSSSGSSSLPLILGICGALVVLLIVVVAIAVASSRKRNRSQGFQAQVGAPAQYGTPPGWGPAQQQYGQPGQQPPPPYGYPPQQPPYNNPYQDGNQSR